MPIQSPYMPNYNANGTFNPTTTAVPQSYVNINAQTPLPNVYQQPMGAVYAKYVSNEQDAFMNLPAPQSGSSFGIDGENLVLYAKFADGHMEVYDMIQREPPKPPQPLTAESLSQLLDQKFNDFESTLSKKFVLRKEGYNQNKGGSVNG